MFLRYYSFRIAVHTMDSPDFLQLAEDASYSCDILIDHCLAIHSKVDALRKSVFQLDDLIFSIKSCRYVRSHYRFVYKVVCSEHLRDHKLRSKNWVERIRTMDGGDTICDVTQRIDEFHNVSIC